jgi:hypothetical protein
MAAGSLSFLGFVDNRVPTAEAIALPLFGLALGLEAARVQDLLNSPKNAWTFAPAAR